MKQLLLLSIISLSSFLSFATERGNFMIPQISVTGPDGMTVIANGDTTPDMLDGTLFMDTATGQSTPGFFNILNNGSLDLNISNITITGVNASDFNIDGMTPVMVSPGMPEGLFINFSPQSIGTKNATITILSDDPSTPSYSFSIQGNAILGGTGLHFDGIDDYVDFPTANYSLNTSFSLELWIEPQISLTNDHYILDTMNGSSGHTLFIDTLGNLVFSFFTSSGIQTLSSTSTLTSQRYHVAVTYDGVTYKLYLNGNLDATLSLSEPVQDSVNNLKLGDIAQGSGLYYNGVMDELRVWDIALGICGIQNSRLCELAGSESNLQAYYKFNEGEANGNNFPIYNILRYNHILGGGAPPEGILTNFALMGTTSNWIDATSNMVSGSCTTYPEASVSGAGITIVDGDTTPSFIDNTDFGDEDINNPLIDNTYTVSNIGTGDLNISNVTITGANAADFTILNSPVGVISSGSSSNLTIGFVPSSVGVKTATVTIINDDCDGSYTFDIQGNAILLGSGLNFDGTDDRIEVSHDAAFNLGTFTIEAYFKTSFTGDDQPIISKYDGSTDEGFSLYVRDTGSIGLQYHSSNILAVNQSSTNGLNDGNWHHIALVFGNEKVQYYIDGVLDNEISFSSSPNAPNHTDPLYIGYSNVGPAYFNGDLDEIRIWSRALCLDEINAQRTCELVNGVSGLVANYSLNQGIVNNDNTAITNASDSSMNNFSGTLTNFTLTGSTSNWIDATANGISGTCNVEIPEINVQGDGNDILSGDTTPDTSDNTDAGTVVVGQTQDMSFFIRNTDGTSDLLVDGIFLTGDTSEFTITQNPSGNPIMATQSASLTIQFNPTSAGLKTAVVTVDSNDCDEPFYTFTIQGYGAGPATGLDFDGTDDFITIPHNSNQNSLNFSADFWIKTTEGNGAIINKFTPDGNNGWRINLDGGRIEFYYYASASNYTTRLLNGATYVADGNWHHVAVTLNSGNARCYIDGVSAHSTGWNGTATAASSAEDIQIGYAASDTPTGDAGGYFEGQLDELRVWTKTLTAFEVATLNSCSADSGQADLLLSYNFNQGITEQDNSGETTLNDSSGNNTNGTLSNFALNGSTSNWIDTTANGISGSCGCVVAGGVTLTNQTEVDNYVNNTLGTCNIIEGDLIINGTVTDLSGFTNVNTISGDLYLEGDIVDDLSGFANLTTIGDDFTLKDMVNTTSIASFSNITNLGGDFTVDNLDFITEITILDQITTLSTIDILNNALLNTITLNQLQTTSGSFRVTFNSSLSTLSIDQLTQVSSEFRVNNIGSGLTSISLPLLEGVGSFRVADITGLTSIDAPELLSVSGAQNIGSCSSLTTINFPKLTSIGTELSIDNSPLLNSISFTVLNTIGQAAQFHDLAVTDLSFLSSVTSIGGNLALNQMNVLANVQGMDNLTSLGGFNFSDCDLVTNLEGFASLSLTSLNTLNISNNELLTTLSNSFLESLTTVESLNVVFNANIIEIDALQNIATITSATHDSNIRANGSLQSINLYALNTVTNSFTIRDMGSITSLCGLYNYVTVGNGSSTLTFAGTNPTNWDSIQDILDNCNSGLAIDVFLQGAALNPNAGEESLMRDDLRVNSLVAETSPYSDSRTISTAVFNKAGTDAIIDWVWLELRDSADNTNTIASRSALLQRDGDIVHTDGVSSVYFDAVAAGDYYVVVNHRNHLGIMTANTVTLSNTSTTVDFTDSSNEITYGTNAQTTFGMQSGVLGMWSGNALNDSSVKFSGTDNDTNQIKSDVLNASGNILGLPTYPYSGYHSSDVNMDGIARFSSTNNDSNYIKSNVINNPSNILGLLTTAIIEQLP